MTPTEAAVQEGPLRTDRLTVHHLRRQAGGPQSPRVLLLGGSNFDLRLKRTFLNAPWVQHCDIVTYEPRGIGRTEQPDGPWTMSDYADDALAVLDAVGWKAAHIVAESFGGMTALHVAARAPQRVTQMIISSATAGGPEHASYDIAEFLDLSRQDAARAALCLQDCRQEDLAKTDPSAFEKSLADRVAFETAFAVPSIASGGYGRLLTARRGHDCTTALDGITAPTTVIAGRFDRQASPAAQHALAERLPNAEFHLMDAGHGVLFSAPEALDVTAQALGVAHSVR